MLSLTLIQLEWNAWNGFIFSLVHVECSKPNMDSALFGVNASENFLYIDLLFIPIVIFDKTS